MTRSPPIGYIARTREYYLGLGYDNPYEWACYPDVPFTPLDKPLSQMRVAIVTTAAPYQAGKGDQGPGAAYNAAAKFFSVYKLPINEAQNLGISHIAYDRVHTHAKDLATYFPLAALQRAQKQGRIGAVAENFYGFPTNRSQRTHHEQDIPQLVEMLKQDKIDTIIAVPNCPVCHQSISLAARAAEAAKIPSVIMGCALDIIEQVGVPRFHFSDFPLGNSCGRPFDLDSQDQSLSAALDLLENTRSPRTTHISDLTWSQSDLWKEDYSNIKKLTDTEIAERRAAFDAAKNVVKANQTP